MLHDGSECIKPAVFVHCATYRLDCGSCEAPTYDDRVSGIAVHTIAEAAFKANFGQVAIVKDDSESVCPVHYMSHRLSIPSLL